LLTVAFASWLIVGLFVDGWAHNDDRPESFFTPWHGMFYSGFAASALWMLVIVQRRQADGATGLGAVPIGYGLGLVGVAVFASGGAFDMAWHELFGVEVGLEALLSPSHLVLFCGALLLITSPLRAAWSDGHSHAPTLQQLVPALLSMTLATASVAFLFMSISPSLTDAMTSSPYRFIAETFAARPGVASWMTEAVQLEGYAAILLTTIILVGPILLLARRWVLPFGTMTLLLGVVSASVAAIDSFDMGLTFVSAPLAGLAGDVLYRRLRPTRRGPQTLWAVGASVPTVMWLSYFAILALFMDVGWPAELWAGATAMSALTGFGLALLVHAPTPPQPADDPSGSWRTSGHS